jgi:hypothetical protein
MSSSSYGAPPPRSDSSSAGDTEVVSMAGDRNVLGKRVRSAGIACLSAVLLFGTASLVSARTRVADSFPDMSGDPTADDQPSPAPKKSAAYTRGTTSSVTVHTNSGTRFVWLTYVRALIRIAIR